jgi:hypothetical protein
MPGPAFLVSTVAVVAMAVASCGGQSSTPSPIGDADAGDGQSEAGTFACGDANCGPSQICVTPAYGCLAETRPDGGVCPGGTEYSDASGDCLQIPRPPSCVSPAPGDDFECEQEGDADCANVGVPIPSGCSHVCRGICI